MMALLLPGVVLRGYVPRFGFTGSTPRALSGSVRAVRPSATLRAAAGGRAEREDDRDGEQ